MNYTFSMVIPNGEMRGTAIGYIPFNGTVCANDAQDAVVYIVGHPEIKRLLELNGMDGQEIVAATAKDVPTALFVHTLESGGTITMTLNPKLVD